MKVVCESYICDRNREVAITNFFLLQFITKCVYVMAMNKPNNNEHSINIPNTVKYTVIRVSWKYF